MFRRYRHQRAPAGFLPPNFFSQKPLNYETFCRRIESYEDLTSETKISPKMPLNRLSRHILDCIRAGRQLQGSLRALVPENNFLGLQLAPNNATIEKTLWRFLSRHYSHLITSNEVVKCCILQPPLPQDISSVFAAVVANFHHNLQKGVVHNDNVRALINTMLDAYDYHGCFRLLDETFNSRAYLERLERRLFHATGGALLGVTALSSLFCISAGTSLIWSGVSLAATSAIGYYWGQFCALGNLHRVSWRNHLLLRYRLLHRQELLMVNKILTHFEEIHEVNIRNFHTSQVRVVSVDHVSSDYVLEDSEDKDGPLVALPLELKHQLTRRKMALNDIREELMFIDFWRNHGADFEWVEPDQDPAEIVKLNLRLGEVKEAKQIEK